MSSYPSAPTASKAGGAGGGGGATQIAFTIPAADVSADLTDFPVVLEHGRHLDFPHEIFSAASGDINVAIDGGDGLQTEIAVFDTTNHKLRIHFKADLSSSVDNDFIVKWDGAPASDGEVFDAYELVTTFYGVASDAVVGDIVNLCDNDTTFTQSEAAPIFANDTFVCGLGYQALSYQMTSSFNTDEFHLAASGANYGSICGAVSVAEAGGEWVSCTAYISSQQNRTIPASQNSSSPTFSGVTSASRQGDECVWSVFNDVGTSIGAYLNGGLKGTTTFGWTDSGDYDRGYIGAAGSGGSDLSGWVREVRVASQLFSDDWVAYEAINMSGARLTNTIS